MHNNSLRSLIRVMQFSDSALPVGGFSFSNTLESAIDVGLVHDYATLNEFSESLLRQAATTDCIAALNAHRATIRGDYNAIIRCDKALLARKANTEQRLMSQRMGRKMAELCAEMTSDKSLLRLTDDIATSRTSGCYAVVQGVVFAICGIGERELFAAICYGTAAMVLNAALRTMRITHRQTQRILYTLAERIEYIYDDIRELDIDQMHSFSPQVDILAAIHEKGAKRLFMN